MRPTPRSAAPTALLPARRSSAHHDEPGSTVRGVVLLAVYAVVAVLVAMLWPTGLGGCTSFERVPASAAGAGLRAGDVVVVRCSEPEVGDSVVHRSSTGAWAVGGVVAERDDEWHVRASGGTTWTVPTSSPALGVVALQLPPYATQLPTAGAIVAAGVVVVVGVRSFAGRVHPDRGRRGHAPG